MPRMKKTMKAADAPGKDLPKIPVELIDATLDLVAAAMQGHELTNTEAAFVLPSAMDAAQLAALTGQTP